MRITFWFRALVLGLCAVVLGSGAAIATPTRPAPPASALQVSGDLELVPGVEIFHVETTARQPAGKPATGTFSGAAELHAGPINVPIPLSLAGPVTCLNVQGSTASFLYEVDKAQPKFLNDLAAGKTSVLFTVVKGSPGVPNRIGFFGPLPTAFFHGCDPISTPFVFNGTVDLSGPATP